MKNSLLKFLACPIDNSFPLTVSEKSIFDETSIERGNLQCSKCRKIFPIKDGIPSFLPDELQKPLDEKENSNLEIKLKLQEMRSRNQEYKTGIYDSYLDPYWAPIEIKSLLKRLKVKTGELILDAGCGNGFETVEIAKFKGVEILAVDFAVESLKVLQERLKSVGNSNVHLVNADLNSLPFMSGICHQAISHGVFQHVSNHPKVLEEFKRVMTDNASLVLTVYNYSSLKAQIASLLPEFIFGRKYLKEGFHAYDIYYHRFAHSELESLLKRFFYVEELTGLLNIPRKIGNMLGKPAAWIDRILENYNFSHQTGTFLLAKCIKKNVE